jgi:outer membrane protein
MKNLPVISIALNVVLIAALAVLYFLHFSLKNQVKQSVASPSAGIAASGSIVYVSIDSLMGNYDLYFDLKKQLEVKQKQAEAEFAVKGNTYQKNVADYQDKAQKGLITRSKAQEVEQQLMADQQNLMKYRDKLTADLAEEEQVMNRQLVNNIVSFLKEYNKNHNYQYIFSHTFGSNLLYAPDSLNITKDVLKGINEQYVKEKGNKK